MLGERVLRGVTLGKGMVYAYNFHNENRGEIRGRYDASGAHGSRRSHRYVLHRHF
jgi:hypothetical protein